MTRVCIVSARRTPQGRFNAALAQCSAVDLAISAGQAALKSIGTQHIDQVIVGNVLAAGQGMNIARQIGVKLGVPIDRPAFTVNMMCASGMQAVILAAQAIRAGEANVILCGGTESMSNAPLLLARNDETRRSDSMLRDGLVDSFDNQHMGVTAEQLAEQYRIDRVAQDTFAIQSQQRWKQADDAGRFATELVPMNGLTRDEHPRPETALAKLATLKTPFKADGTVTPGNSSGINDGAAMLVVCSEAAAKQHGWPVLAVIGGYASRGCDPRLMGLGPVHATRALLTKLKVTLDDFDTIEINEAFAAQALACLSEFGLPGDAAHVNPDGGAIAMGHPIGSSGARLVTHLAHRIHAGQTRRGLATLCVGGGMGTSIALTAADASFHD